MRALRRENVEALKGSADSLRKDRRRGQGSGAVASRRLADACRKLAESNEARETRRRRFSCAAEVVLDQLKNSLQAQPVSLQTCRRSGERLENQGWPDAGRGTAARRSQRQRDAAQFASAVLAPSRPRSAGPVSILKSGDTVVRAFIEAGVWALVVISLLLWLALRRITDVLLTLVPLLVAGAGDTGNLRAYRVAAQFCQYRRTAAAAWRRRRIQDLLCDGLAVGQNESAAVEPDASDIFQRADDSHRIRKPVAIQSSRYFEHGASFWRSRSSRRSPRCCCSSRR
jgi:hypothetical protein